MFMEVDARKIIFTFITVIFILAIINLTFAKTAGVWNIIPSPNVGNRHNQLFGVDAVSPYDAWAVGYSGVPNGPPYATQSLILKLNGHSWNVVGNPTFNNNDVKLNDVFVLSSKDAIAVGRRGNVCCLSYNTLIERWNGTSWSVIPSPDADPGNYNELKGVDGASANNIWAVGHSMGTSGLQQNMILHWNGNSWTVAPSPNFGSIPNRLHGVSASSENNVWAVD